MSSYNTSTYYYYPRHVSETFTDNYCYITAARTTKPRPAIYPSHADPAATSLPCKDKRFGALPLTTSCRPHRCDEKSVPDTFNTHASHCKSFDPFATYRADGTLCNHCDSSEIMSRKKAETVIVQQKSQSEEEPACNREWDRLNGHETIETEQRHRRKEERKRETVYVKGRRSVSWRDGEWRREQRREKPRIVVIVHGIEE